MTDQIETLCDILDMDSTGITPDTALSSLEGWDSMAIVMITSVFGESNPQLTIISQFA